MADSSSQNLEMVNEAYVRMHEYSVKELQGQPISQVFAPEFRDQLPKIFEQLPLEGFLSFESVHIRKDGTTLPSLVTVSAIIDLNGQTLYRVANVIDSSDLKETQQALMESQQIYHDLVQTIEAIVWEREFPSMQITFVSQYAEHLLGVIFLSVVYIFLRGCRHDNAQANSINAA